MIGRILGLIGGCLMFLALTVEAQRPAGGPASFDHARHAKLFVACSTCHGDVSQTAGARFPTVTQCATCHDGKPLRIVAWQPRVGPRPSNLTFDHRSHQALRVTRGDTGVTCTDCHTPSGGGWMQVRAPEAAQCLSCHRAGSRSHLALSDTACATCHVPLSRAVAFTRERIAAIPRPPSHAVAGFQGAGGHGIMAKHTTAREGVASSCATCHVQPYCTWCHVDAPEVKQIQALGFHPLAGAVPRHLDPPANHARADFELRHGALAGPVAQSCRTCHTQESCTTCHLSQLPAAAKGLYHAGPGRGRGAVTTARRPTTHTPTWKTAHGVVASASIRSCSGCHTRESCLTCHVPSPAQRGGYHPVSYLTRHPADAYSRSSSCAECHNQAQFCQSCHQAAGVVAQRTLLGAGGYHDGKRQFFVGHGQAARQSLETCASCHVERDCLTCHSAQKGRGFSPHGPGFDSERMLRKNPQLCMACHGTAIPRR